MADVFDPGKRSQVMAGIRGKNTRPEVLVRSLLHRAGYRFRIHSTAVPGHPDVWLPKYRAAVFVHGCFWHCHDCHLFKWPANNAEFWRAKIERNAEVDRRHLQALADLDVRVLVVWECALKGKHRLLPDVLQGTLVNWLRSGQLTGEVRGGQDCE